MEYSTRQETGPSFADIAKEWWDLHSPTLAPNSLKNYKPAYRRAVDEFGDIPIRRIAPRDIKRFLTAFARGNRARKTVSTQLLICNLIFSYAVESGVIEVSPSTHIKVPANLSVTHRDTASEADEAVIKQSADVWLLPTFTLYTGLRRGEALALTWGGHRLKQQRDPHHQESLPRRRSSPHQSSKNCRRSANRPAAQTTARCVATTRRSR